jgi:hypothetical protein
MPQICGQPVKSCNHRFIDGMTVMQEPGGRSISQQRSELAITFGGQHFRRQVRECLIEPNRAMA